jgi:hypothetical protein
MPQDQNLNQAGQAAMISLCCDLCGCFDVRIDAQRNDRRLRLASFGHQTERIITDECSTWYCIVSYVIRHARRRRSHTVLMGLPDR